MISQIMDAEQNNFNEFWTESETFTEVSDALKRIKELLDNLAV